MTSSSGLTWRYQHVDGSTYEGEWVADRQWLGVDSPLLCLSGGRFSAQTASRMRWLLLIGGSGSVSEGATGSSARPDGGAELQLRCERSMCGA